MNEAFQEIERAVVAALGTYSNVHRGSGHHSVVTTHLYEQARDIVLEHLGLTGQDYVVIFCSPRRAKLLESRLAPGTHRCVSSGDTGLPLGIRAMAVRRKSLPAGVPFETGGGTARLVAPGWVIWAKAPERFEAGTPAITNVIAFARTLQLMRKSGRGGPLFPDASTRTGEVAGPDPLDGLSGRELLARLRDDLIGRGARVPTADGERGFVNLDNAASTPTFLPIWNVVREAWSTSRDQHAAVIEKARTICAAALGAPSASFDLIFTSNTTEATNLVAASFEKKVTPDVEPVVLTTFVEHNSNELPWRAIPGVAVIRLPMDEEGFVDPAAVEAELRSYNQAHAHGRKRIELVAVTGASNVLGVYNDVAELGRIAHRYGAQLLVDGAQWVAHREMDIESSDIDFFAFSGHKVHAPFGTGVLVARKGLLAFSPSELAEIQSSGEENVGGVAAVAKALELLRRIGFDTIQAEEQALTRRALSGLAAMPHVKVLGLKSPDSPRFGRRGGVILFNVKGRLPGTVARTLAERGGIGVRYGCHCAHLTIKRVLRVPPWAENLQWAMVHLIPGFSPPGLVRASFGLQNGEADVDAFLEELRSRARHRTNRELRRRVDDYVHAAVARVLGPLSL